MNWKIWHVLIFIVKSYALAKKMEESNAELTVGEEMEIELSMFISQEEQGKLYKERFNFASFDCGATIVKTNKEAKSAGAILTENKDSYLLNPCFSQNKYVIIELCEDILIDEIEMSNFEFYSSMFKEIRLSASDRFPTTNWVSLGEFQAENVRTQQRFQIENPLIWSKFIRLEVLSHYGDEYYCPITSIQVFGTTMIEQLKEETIPTINETKYIKDQSDEAIGYSSNITFREVDYNFDCVARPQVVMEKFLDGIKYEFGEDQCTVNGSSNNNSSNNNANNTIFAPNAIPKKEKVAPQDSIYININKRLNELERNSTLSLLYQEEQARILSDAFLKFETLQLERFQNLIGELNSTHTSHLEVLRKLSWEIKMKNQLISNEIMKLNEIENQQFKNQLNGLNNQLWWFKILFVINFSILIFVVFKLIEITSKANEIKLKSISTSKVIVDDDDAKIDIVGVGYKIEKSKQVVKNINKKK